MLVVSDDTKPTNNLFSSALIDFSLALGTKRLPFGNIVTVLLTIPKYTNLSMDSAVVKHSEPSISKSSAVFSQVFIQICKLSTEPSILLYSVVSFHDVSFGQ